LTMPWMPGMSADWLVGVNGTGTAIIYGRATQRAPIGTIYYNCSHRIASVVDSQLKSHIQQLVRAESLRHMRDRSHEGGATCSINALKLDCRKSKYFHWKDTFRRCDTILVYYYNEFPLRNAK
jgi:hypothetical protein